MLLLFFSICEFRIFNQLLLVFILTAFSSSKKDHIGYTRNLLETRSNDDALLKHQKYTVGTDGGIYYNQPEYDKYEYDELDINSDKQFPPLQEGNDETSDQFRLIKEDDVDYLKASQKLQFDFYNCGVLSVSIINGEYALYGFSAYANHNANITPSIIYGVESLPDKIYRTYEDYLDGQVTEDYFSGRGCSDDQDLYRIGFEFGGVVSSDCISNKAILPESDQPSQPNQCEIGIPFVKYLEGFKLWSFQYFTVEQFKRVLSRVGVAFGYIWLYFGGPTSAIRENIIFLGWEIVDDIESWIVAEQVYTEEVDGVNYYYDYHYEVNKIPMYPEGIVIQEFTGYVLYCDSDICPKPQIPDPIYCEDYPDDETCVPYEEPITYCEVDQYDDCECPEDTTFTQECKEYQKGQPIIPDKCKTITIETSLQDCPCPTTPAELEKDPRKDICAPQDVPKGASGSIHTMLSLNVAVLVLPFVMLLC
ncbi:MAG: hypothetical protein EZS28_012189 [Streblomastix strix]|uniref:Uncharacterized protein n=1 Tax=Streblomastix strix TaxID=222440 RepID=A0A5J4WC98_9EUKA|nr:MAG: hypothetical protein EZS28_012189 [Streblomastix strix]